VDESRKISDLKTYRDIIEKLVIPKLTAGMFTDSPAETVDGTRTSFNTTRNFYENTLAVYVDGSRIHTDDFIVTGNRTVTLKTTPSDGKKIVFDYVPMDI